MFELAPILKSLWRNKAGPVLIVVQLALTIAIVSNALFFIHQRMEKINRPTGIAANELVRMWVKTAVPDADLEFIVKRDMDVVRAVPGVIDAVPISHVPLSGSGSSSEFRTGPEENSSSISANYYEITDHGIETLGMKLVAGRDFRSDDVMYIDRNTYPKRLNAIVTKQFAEQLFSQGSAVGKTFYIANGIPVAIIGVVEQMLGAWPDWDNAGNAVFYPGVILDDSIDYLVRTKEDEREKVLLAVMEKLRQIDNSRMVVDEKTMERVLRETYAGDYAMIKMLSLVIFMLVFVNVLGIVGLTTFWVNQRRKQIGIRRALGATKFAIVRYFVLENIMLCVCGAVCGGILAFLASDYMVRHYSLALLPWPYIPITGGLLLALTVLAAYLPAWRASLVSPAEATASV